MPNATTTRASGPLREWAFEYDTADCAECESAHPITINVNIRTDDPEVAEGAGESVAYHEATRSCSPTDSNLVSVHLTGNPPNRWNKTVER